MDTIWDIKSFDVGPRQKSNAKKRKEKSVDNNFEKQWEGIETIMQVMLLTV